MGLSKDKLAPSSSIVDFVLGYNGIPFFTKLFRPFASEMIVQALTGVCPDMYHQTIEKLLW